jgi:hypothetical protein
MAVDGCSLETYVCACCMMYFKLKIGFKFPVLGKYLSGYSCGSCDVGKVVICGSLPDLEDCGCSVTGSQVELSNVAHGLVGYDAGLGSEIRSFQERGLIAKNYCDVRFLYGIN